MLHEGVRSFLAAKKKKGGRAALPVGFIAGAKAGMNISN
jgi:hypothetical protein